jgi:hypothetical protein
VTNNKSSAIFSALINDFRENIAKNREILVAIAKRNPHMAYQKINELALFVGSRYKVSLQLHFPVPAKITDVDSYGTENIGLVVDKFRRTFPIAREVIKQKAIEVLGPDTKALDAYMYEGKEGVKLVTKDGGRLEILPGSLHVWCELDYKVTAYADWLMENVYNNPSPATTASS